MIKIAGEHIGFDIDAPADGVVGKKGVFEGVGDDGEAKAIFENIVDGEADAVDGDGTFWDDVFDILCRDGDVKIGSVGEFFDFGDGADCVDVPLYDVPFEAVAQLHGGLHVDAPFEVLHRDGLLGFGREFDGEGTGGFAHDGEAGAVDGDGVADAGFVAAFDGEEVVGEVDHFAGFAYESCKHVSIIPNYTKLCYNRAIFMDSI